MSFPDALRTSIPRVSPLVPIVLIAIAIVAFASGSAAADSTGGVGPGGSGGSNSQIDESKYERIWNKVPAVEKRWARSTSECESGGDPDAIGGGGAFRGAFQFMKSTWKSSPKSPGGDPITYDYRTQAVVAVLLKKRDGAGHWPVCG